MIQIQNGRLHFNWLGEGTYPRYAALRSGFEQALAWLRSFIESRHLGDFQPNQWETTYINHIPRGSVWRSPSDWQFCRLVAQANEAAPSIPIESFEGEWHFVIPPDRGRLHVKWQHGRKGDVSDKEEVEIVLLTLTARGPIKGAAGAAEAIMTGLDLGRQTIVNAFHSLMTPEANQYWGLESERQ